MSRALPSPGTWNKSVNMYVPGAQFSADVGTNGQTRVEFGAPDALDADGILSAQSIAAVADVTSFANTYSDDVMGRYGRNATAVASGAATSKIGIYGRDYLGQPVYEQLTLNGATTVQGKKAFASIYKVAIEGATAATTVNVGWGDKLGLPYRTTGLDVSFEDGVSATAGTLTNGASADTDQTGTSNDPRGLYVPNTATNGAHTYAAIVSVDLDALYGIAHFTQ